MTRQPEPPQRLREPLDPVALPLVGIGLCAAVLAWAAAIGVSAARHAPANTVAMSATLLVFGPVLGVALSSQERRLRRTGVAMILWSLALFVGFPVYFPGERRESLLYGLSLLTGSEETTDWARGVADAVPDEASDTKPILALADEVRAECPPTTMVADAQNSIRIPYEGEGRRLTLPVDYVHGGRTVETYMMLDTGATYTTLPTGVLTALGALPGPDAPVLTLNTANGEREAHVVLIDEVWLGDRVVRGVAITTCEDCASDTNVGLLGLNVTGGFNMTIDQDRREVVFAERDRFNRRLDVRPFSDLQARFVRYGGGRVEVELAFENRSLRPILSAMAQVKCQGADWEIPLDRLEPGAAVTVERRLPPHDRCETYQIELADASW